MRFSKQNKEPLKKRNWINYWKEGKRKHNNWMKKLMNICKKMKRIFWIWDCSLSIFLSLREMTINKREIRIRKLMKN